MIVEKLSNQRTQINLFFNGLIALGKFLVPLLIMASLMNGYLFLKNPNMGSDAIKYHSAVHNLLAGKGWVYSLNGSYIWAPVEPGYGMLSYIFYLFVRDIEYAGMLVSSISYLLMIPVTFFTVKFLFGKWTALLASVLIVFWPTLISYSYINLTDCTYTFFLLFGFSLYTRVLLDKGTFLKSVLLGLILGFTYLIREPEGLLVAALAICSLFIFAIVDLNRMERKQRFFISSLKSFVIPTMALLSFLVVVFSYMMFIYAQSGVRSLSIKVDPINDMPGNMDAQVETSTIAISETSSANAQDESGVTITPVATTPDVSNSKVFQKDQLFAGILAYSPYLNLSNIAKNAGVLVMRLASINAHGLVPLALLGIISPFLLKKQFFALRRPNLRRARLILSFVIFSSPVLLHLLVSSLHSRYLMQYSVYILIAAAFLIVRFLERLLESSGKNHFDKWVIFVCLLSVVVSLGISSPSLYDALTASHPHLGIRAAGLWLRDNVQNPDDLAIIASRKGTVALFYANGKKFSMGSSKDVRADMTLEKIERLVIRDKIDYLLLDNHYIHTLPLLDPWWNNPSLAQEFGLSLLHQDSNDLFQIYTSANSP